MTKFKAGDRVRLKQGVETGLGKDHEVLRTWEEGFTYPWTGYFGVDDSWLELITSKETTVMARRTFKQLKEDPTIKKGALWQEMCEDGTQAYRLLDSQSHKAGDRPEITDRKLVEDQPEWFVEVFKVEPEYMTAEELERYKAFIKLGPVKDITFKPAKRKYTKRAVKRGPGRPRKVTQ